MSKQLINYFIECVCVCVFTFWTCSCFPLGLWGTFAFLEVPSYVAGNFYRFLKWRLFAWSFSRWGFSNQTLSIYHKDIHPNQSTLHLRLFTVWNKSLSHYSQWNNETLVLAMGESSQGCSPVDGNRLVIWQPIKKIDMQISPKFITL